MFTHINDRGAAHMVDISEKSNSARCAVAECWIHLSETLVKALQDEDLPKGDVFACARIAGIQAAKATAQLIPLCHTLPLSSTQIDFEMHSEQNKLRILASCKTNAQTGVEMEAMTAVSIAALTFYDMCKAIDKGIVIEQTRLLSKSGGKSGLWQREN